MHTMLDLRGRSLLTLNDFSAEELTGLLDLAAELKAAKREGREARRLEGKTIAVISDRDPTRTRPAFEIAAYDQGAHVTFIGPLDSDIGHRETIKDTARVLGRMFDAIEYRGLAESAADEFAAWSGVPVYNGLTDESHPTQILADLLTIREHVDKPLSEVAFCHLGDARRNMADTYLVGGAKLGMDVRLAAPRELWPAGAVVDAARGFAGHSGSRLTVTDDIDLAVRGCDVLITGAWLSARMPDDLCRERIEALRPYQVNAEMMRRSGNPDVKFMHRLPAFHNPDTELGREFQLKYGMNALEVTEEVFESEASIVFDEAENRLHTIKATIVATLGA